MKKIVRFYNEEIDMFIRMIFSSHYVGGYHRGHNYRSGGKTYINFFSKEYIKLRNLDPDNGIKIPDNDQSFNDRRIIFIWRLYSKYMKERFNLTKVLRKLENYMALLIERNSINVSNRGTLYDSFTVQSFSSCCTAFVAIFKLLSRKLIPQNVGINILKHLHKLIYLHKYLYPEIITEDIFQDVILQLVIRLNKEIKEKEDYYPVRLLHDHNIYFRTLYPRIPTFFGEG